MENSGMTAIALLQGEVVEDRLGKGANAILLTNKRVIRTSRDGNTKDAVAAFLTDIVLVRVSTAGRNPGRIILGIALIALGLAWFIYRGSTGSYSEWLAVGPLIGAVLFGLVATAGFIVSGGAEVTFQTPGGAISCSLNRKAAPLVYPFVNRCLELKDGGSTGARRAEGNKANMSPLESTNA